MPAPTLLSSEADLRAYGEWLKFAPGASLWQSWEWKTYREALGRETRLYGLKNEAPQGVLLERAALGAASREALPFAATALVIIDRTAFGLSTWDIPRGPLFTDPETASDLLQHIVEEAQTEGAMVVYSSPPHKLETKNYKRVTSRPSGRGEQPEATIILDLTRSDEELLAAMHPKARYNLRLAERHGIRVEESRDIQAFTALLRETAGRDGFTPLPPAHYEHFLHDLPGSFLLLAYEGELGRKNREVRDAHNSHLLIPTSRAAKQPIAGLLGVTWQGHGYYSYGASDYRFRALMAPHLLQQAAWRLCRECGCRTYDLLGIAPEGAREDHPWSGVSRFKQQFGGKIVTYPREREIVLRPVVKKLLGWKRSIVG